MANVQKDVMLRTKGTASIVINTALVLRFAISTKRNYITISSAVNILPLSDYSVEIVREILLHFCIQRQFQAFFEASPDFWYSQLTA